MSDQKAKKHNLKAVPNKADRSQTGDVSVGENVCPICFGSGLEVVPDKGARRCICRKRDHHMDHLDRAQLPKRYENCHFESYRSQNVSQERAKKVAYQFATEYPAVDRGLLLIGSVGVGKTHLAVSILKALSERGFSALFYEFGSLLKEIQGSYNPNTFTSELSVLAPVLTSEVLVLDELGASKPTDWVRDTLYHIINSRYNENKFTIFTTNYPDERTDVRKETLEDRIGVSTRSRLFEMCKTIAIDGPDFRRSLDNSNRGI